MKRLALIFLSVFVFQLVLADNIVLTAPYISGNATENGGDVTLNELKPGGVSGGIYETFQRLQPGTFVLKGTYDGKIVVLGNDDDGKLVENGSAFTVSDEQVVRVRYDSNQATLTITPVQLYLKGNIVADGTTVAYKGNGVFEQQVDMNYGTVFLFQDKYFYFAFNNDDNLAVKRLSGSRTAVCMPSEGFSGENIRLNRGTYTIGLDMNSYTWTIDAPIDEYKISAFGSSVCNGTGATDNKGYAYLYGQQCESRTVKGKSEYPFYVSGVAIGGNTTLNLLDRYDEMIHDFGKYVIIGLSMGNEGIHGAADQEAIYNQFRDNMLKLIDMMEKDGKTVVVMNNYTRGDYTSTDYSYIKNMNRLIHQWDVPSVNTLGAIDNGEGKWADGYESDPYHPTTAGHRQFMYAIPPSLFDALEQGKALPTRDLTQSTTLENGSTIQFKGETAINPFTVTVRIKGQDVGKVISVTGSSSKKAYLSVIEDGYVQYISTSGDTITSDRSLVKDADTWYDITLTNYFAQQRTLVYCNRTLVGEISETIAPRTFIIGDPDKALHREYSELSFWRSAMNVLEINDHYNGKMMKSSLEIYSPLSDDIKSGESIANLAQSLNAATYVQGEVSDAVKSVQDNQNADTKNLVCYTVDGKRIASPRQGINVIDGKKYLVK